MKFLLILAVLTVPVMACYIAYAVGYNRALRRPHTNHNEAIRLLEDILRLDEYVPILQDGQREWAKRLTDDYMKILMNPSTLRNKEIDT